MRDLHWLLKQKAEDKHARLKLLAKIFEGCFRLDASTVDDDLLPLVSSPLQFEPHQFVRFLLGRGKVRGHKDLVKFVTATKGFSFA